MLMAQWPGTQYSVVSISLHSLPWYNRNGWLGIKHQVTYFIPDVPQVLPAQLFFYHMDTLTHTCTPHTHCHYLEYVLQYLQNCWTLTGIKIYKTDLWEYNAQAGIEECGTCQNNAWSHSVTLNSGLTTQMIIIWSGTNNQFWKLLVLEDLLWEKPKHINNDKHQKVWEKER